MELRALDRYRFRIPRDERLGMRTDVIVYASQNLIGQIRKDLSLEQAMNVATLPGIVGPSLAMPDIHQGYGFPIGGVAATEWENGVVSPGGVGFDINCGVRSAATSLTEEEVRPKLRDLVHQLFRDVPSGAGGEGPVRINGRQLDEVLAKGARWMVENGYGEERDLEFAEENGRLEELDPHDVSSRAKERGRPQLGTIGSGNHFVEVQYVDEIHNGEAARAMGIEKKQVVVMIHCGSRGLGHQVCTDYVGQMGAAMKRHNISMPDRQLACAPIQSSEGQTYLSAMRASANFAWANRQAVMQSVRDAFRKIFGKSVKLDLIYDVCHNIAKREKHVVNGKKTDVLVHRKGATRAFPPGHRSIPGAYREVGQPVLIPGSMGTASWILTGSQAAMEQTFGSVCHGAGRLLSRTAARKGRDAKQVQSRLEEDGIIVRSESRDGILEEIPEAYKDVDEVIEVVHQAGLAVKVARLRPMGVIKG
ncbi:MAG: RtcB family protein [Bryobacteraceae bacterium]|nr:RtcB family protein [Bryobacterales bacterium]MEB2361410.1 RtcB family protein [Bryobacterales bacterium]NUN02792.1 RtcB family protein [Bryobacteraceae bacterium]